MTRVVVARSRLVTLREGTWECHVYADGLAVVEQVEGEHRGSRWRLRWVEGEGLVGPLDPLPSVHVPVCELERCLRPTRTEGA